MFAPTPTTFFELPLSRHSTWTMKCEPNLSNETQWKNLQAPLANKTAHGFLSAR